MKIVILTQYFPPEVGAPQNRLFDLALRLKNEGDDVTVLTAMPNYPEMRIHEAYHKKIVVTEFIRGIKVIRCPIYVTQSKSIVKRLMNYFSFTISSFLIGLFKIHRHDFLICESPPLFLGKSGWMLSVIHRSRFVFNVSDLWPESAEKLGLVKNKAMLSLAKWLEEFLYKRSYLITGQTKGIVNDISRRFPAKKVYWLPNGADVGYYEPEKNNTWRKNENYSDTDFILYYAGIIGHAQGLEIILHAAAKTVSEINIKYAIIGSGPEKSKLEKLCGEMNLKSVRFFDSVAKTEILSIMHSVDATIIPLRKLDLFLGAIPSKIFENLAMKIPVLLGVDGEAREIFVEQGKCTMYFEPENAGQLAEKIMLLYKDKQMTDEMIVLGRKFVTENFERKTIALNFRKQLSE